MPSPVEDPSGDLSSQPRDLLKLLPAAGMGLGATVLLVLGVLVALVQLGVVRANDLALKVVVWSLSAGLLVLVVVAIVSTMRRVPSGSTDGPSSGGESEPEPQRQTVIGLHLGRQTMQCGAITVPFTVSVGDERDLLAVTEAGGAGEIVTPFIDVDYHDGSGVFDRAAKLILDVIGRLESQHPELLPLHGIGIALPGVLDPRRRLLRFSAGALPAGTLVATEIIDHLVQRSSLEHLRRVFGTPAGADRSQLARRVRIDNDATATARAWIMHEADVSDVACLIVGEGVGAGLAVGGRLLYGARFSAGEVGHQVMEISSGLSSYGISGDAWPEAELLWSAWLRDLSGMRCPCGRKGVHWEMATGGDALLRLLALVDGQMCDTLVHLSASGSGLRLWHLENARKIISSNAQGQEQGRSLVSRYQDMLEMAARLFAVPLAIGISNLVDVLDLKQVILVGRIPSILERGLHDAVASIVRGHSLHGDVDVVIHGRGKDLLWRGAAQLFADPTYARLVAPDLGHSQEIDLRAVAQAADIAGGT